MSALPQAKPANGGNVLGERSPALPSRGEFEAMARRRHQQPTPYIHGVNWVIDYRIDVFENGKIRRVQKRQALAPAEKKQREVLKLRDEFMAPLNHGSVSASSAVTFRDYVEQVYKRNKLPGLEAGSQDRYENVLRNYLLPAFGDKMLRELTFDTVQAFFTGLAVKPQIVDRGSEKKPKPLKVLLSLESRRKIWTVFSSVLTQARKGGHLMANPAEGIDLGRDWKGTNVQPFITPKQFDSLLAIMTEPYATMLYTACFTGLSVSELAGLRWRNIDAAARLITVEQKYSRGNWGAPKSSARNASIIVARSVMDRIFAMRGVKVNVRAGRAVRVFEAVKSCGPDDLVFQSIQAGQPINDGNILRRHIKPAGAQIGIPWVNWLALRRSTATWHKRAGTHIKDAQRLMRHEHETTTLRHYTQIEYETQVEAVDRLERYVQAEITARVN
jgi:integrase